MTSHRFKLTPGALFHGAVILLLLGVLRNVLLNLLVFRRPDLAGKPQEAPPPDGRPRVSVLIPARNEEKRLGPCLDSLIAQTERSLEIIVLDDQSEDATSEVALARGFVREANTAAEQTAIAGGDPPLSSRTPRRLLRGLELRTGWVGKNWACWQLAQAAQGDWLLFTDADTVHRPECVAAAVAHAERTGADLLSIWPEQRTGTWSERLVIPLGYLLILGFLPQWLGWLAGRFPRAARLLPPGALKPLGAANGQFVLFRRAHYFGLGGHRAVSRDIVEDVALGQATMALAGQGRKLVNADGSRLLTCRMYTGFADMWEGFSKNLRAAFSRQTPFVVFGVFQYVCFVQPFLLLLAPWRWARRWRPLIGIQLALIYLIRGIFTAKYRTGWLSWLLHPCGHALALIIGCNSWRLTHSTGVTWKGRRYTQQPAPRPGEG